jgi:hypothetical protein
MVPIWELSQKDSSKGFTILTQRHFLYFIYAEAQRNYIFLKLTSIVIVPSPEILKFGYKNFPLIVVQSQQDWFYYIVPGRNT